MTRRFLTIGRKFGLIYLLLVVVLAGVCAVVLTNVHAMRTDAKKLLEEIKEAVRAGELVEQVRELQSLLQLHGELPQATATIAPRIQQRLAAAQEELSRLIAAQSTHDPSRPEHQETEDRLAARIASDLDAVSRALREQSGPDVPPERLDQPLLYAQVFEEETRHEAELAEADLDSLARRSTLVMTATVVAAAVVLCLALWLVFATIVRPIQRLRRGADRFGSGALEHRIRLPARDEIGDLARSFDAMADRIEKSQRDLEERVQERTRQLLRAARLADLGTLAAGIAHEINNPLASIASCAEGLQRRLQRGEVSGEEEQDYLQTIASQAYRAKDITGRLLALARQEHGPMVEVDLAHLCQEVRRIVHHQMEKAGVALQIDKPAAFPRLRANEAELTQAMVNLLLNACDATPAGGTVRVRCSARNGEVVLEVADQGPGVAAEDLDRIFEPFFTRKSPGKGTGLGLSLVAAIAEGHGGTVEVHNRPEGGAAFRLRLPAVSGAPS